MSEVTNLTVEEKFALFYGVMLGDGCLSLYKNKEGRNFFAISISGNYYDDQDFYLFVLLPLINSLRTNKKPIKIKKRIDQGKLEILFCDKKLFNKVNFFGFPIGKKGTILEIPKAFFRNGLLKYTIQGFFATDGSIVLTKNPNKYYPRIEACGISKKLISQICEFLNYLGMNGKFYVAKRIKKHSKWKKIQQQYRFQFNGSNNLILFNNLIGFVNPKHRRKFTKFMDYRRNYIDLMKESPSFGRKDIRNLINLNFIEDMAALGVEPRTSSS